MHRRIYRLAVNATLVVHDAMGEDRPTCPIEGIPQPKLTEVDLLEDAFRAMVRTRKAGCLNARCPPSAGVAHTRQCSNCKVVLYCGEKVRRHHLVVDIHKLTDSLHSARNKLGRLPSIPTRICAPNYVG